MPFAFKHPYSISPEYSTAVAYFSMEFAIHQPLKIYAGGLGFLAGSHMRSAFQLKQNMVGVGILWKYGYYDQVRKSDQGMEVLFQEKVYGFLKDTGIKFAIKVAGHGVWVTAYYLPPEIFNTAPLFLLTTDLPENDHLSKTISHKLYDPNPETRIAASILLGVGGVKLLNTLDWNPEVYHMNESHALPLAFYLYNKSENKESVKKQLVFTSHTPEQAGNPQTDFHLLLKMGFFAGMPVDEVKRITQTEGNTLNHALAALRMSRVANAVSSLHYATLQQMWAPFAGICSLTWITNAQNFTYWADKAMYKALDEHDDEHLQHRKHSCKIELFETVADQNGEIFNENTFTIVFAKRFAGYKRPDLLLYDMDRFHKIVSNPDRPVQIIWAGKPYPMDYTEIGVFDRIVNVCKTYPNCSVLVGYELRFSRLLKQGADVWLNVPRLTHEASGTSGMSAAMNGAINMAIPDGWFPEFAKDRINSFVIPPAHPRLPSHQQDEADAHSLYDLLENVVIPTYYDDQSQWMNIVKRGMIDIRDAFDSNRMAHEYYQKLYNVSTCIDEHNK